MLLSSPAAERSSSPSSSSLFSVTPRNSLLVYVSHESLYWMHKGENKGNISLMSAQNISLLPCRISDVWDPFSCLRMEHGVGRSASRSRRWGAIFFQGRRSHTPRSETMTGSLVSNLVPLRFPRSRGSFLMIEVRSGDDWAGGDRKHSKQKNKQRQRIKKTLFGAYLCVSEKDRVDIV